MINWINEIGFLPLFKNEIEGFSVEEHTFGPFWWSGDPEECRRKIYDQVRNNFPSVTEKQLERVLR